MSERRRPIVLTCSRGAETALAEEIRTILPGSDGLDVRVLRGAVQFDGTREDGYRVCLWSRLASRVLVPLGSFDCPDAEALYEGVQAMPWRDHLDHRNTLAVDFVGLSDEIRNSKFGAMVVKDAIVDRIRSYGEGRPSVDLQAPDLRINLRLAHDVATVAVDLSGDALHRRGDGGRIGGPAPLKETLAATIIWMTGWLDQAADGVPLVDPMCGSGTLLTEAAGFALDRAPGLLRSRWGFSRWRAHDRPTWRRLSDEAADRADAAAHRQPALFGSDIHARAMDTTLANVTRLGVEVKLARRDVADLSPPLDNDPPGVLVTNPPYGERLGDEEESAALNATIGDVLKRRFPGWNAWVLAGSPALAKRFGLKPTAKIELRNGPLDCRLVHLEIGDAAKSDRGPGWRKAGPGAQEDRGNS
jgi:23S rRNA (guanine2445-N2)-methyltransferase / 23S rRNA (guanine2069-N7)-methyltransferase